MFRQINLFSFDLLFFPIEEEEHWTLVVVDFRTSSVNESASASSGSVTFYNSLGHPMPKALENIQKYLRNEYIDKKVVRTTIYSIFAPCFLV